MKNYAFRLVNVFAETLLSGNPLCVFEDARGLRTEQMQALALQFNLSETTFVLPPNDPSADALVRIFAPGYEMRFAGHPTLGTAHVVDSLVQSNTLAVAGGSGARSVNVPSGASNDLHRGKVTLEFLAGLVPVQATGDRWTFKAPTSGQPKVSQASISAEQIAASFGLKADELADQPEWVDTGTDQLLVPVKHPDSVRAAKVRSELLDTWPLSSIKRKTAYLFAFDPTNPEQVLARYFFTTSGGTVSEDPGTGSACANLGGWILHHRVHGAAPGTKLDLPRQWSISQGEQTGRACQLTLSLDVEHQIFVGGRVLELARGVVSL
jgi:trans-2,3-dihydro-3-hydroxyanthranilate isomerase